MPRVHERVLTESELEAALEAIAEGGRLEEAQAIVERAAPQLQRLLGHALREGGWFDQSHDATVLKAATTPEESERLTAVRTLLAEEARLGMMVGVAVGFALAQELSEKQQEETD